jgi:hypothetical protein
MASITIVVSSKFYSKNWYKNPKREVIKRNSNIYFNKQYIHSGLVPKHARIKKVYFTISSFIRLFIDMPDDCISTGRNM